MKTFIAYFCTSLFKIILDSITIFPAVSILRPHRLSQLTARLTAMTGGRSPLVAALGKFSRSANCRLTPRYRPITTSNTPITGLSGRRACSFSFFFQKILNLPSAGCNALNN